VIHLSIFRRDKKPTPESPHPLSQRGEGSNTNTQLWPRALTCILLRFRLHTTERMLRHGLPTPALAANDSASPPSGASCLPPVRRVDCEDCWLHSSVLIPEFPHVPPLRVARRRVAPGGHPFLAAADVDPVRAAQEYRKGGQQ